MIINVLEHTLVITGFVGLMMLVVEYVNVLSRGTWQDVLADRKWTQYLVAAVLGATPGCLGAFAIVAMYSHRVVTIGALVTAMIATSGDEAFVMFALFPGKAFLLTGVLAIIGLLCGFATDSLITGQLADKLQPRDKLEIHNREICECFPKSRIVMQWQQLSLARGVLALALLLFVFGIVTSSVGPPEWGWKRITLALTSLVGLFIVSTVPEHFLQEHLWKHIALQHIHRVFLWTFGALLLTDIIVNQLHLQDVIQQEVLLVTLIACLVGIIPESGPHLFFVTLYAEQLIPFTVLLAGSIVQDGHGMLPLLAHSRKGFLLVKTINLLVGLAIGVAAYFIGV